MADTFCGADFDDERDGENNLDASEPGEATLPPLPVAFDSFDDCSLARRDGVRDIVSPTGREGVEDNVLLLNGEGKDFARLLGLVSL